MKRIFTLRFMLISLFAAMGMTMNAETIKYTDGDFKYSLDTETKTAALSKYSGSATKVTIPESVTYYGVTYSVTRLGNGCFDFCWSLTSIDIPSSVTSIGDNCFRGCSSLTSIDIPSSVTSLGNWCFSSCSSLTSIDIPSSVTSLGNSCFYGCKSLTSIDIPSSVTSLGNSCFCDCSALTSIDIPSSVTSLGDECFSHCSSLTSIIVDENNPVYDSRENCNAIINTQSNTMITGCASTVIPSSVTSLGTGCFSGCRALTSIDIPSSVTSLGKNCFSYCSSLTSIAIPSSVTSLGKFCFCCCSALTSIVIPSSVTSLGRDCFWDCKSIKTMTCDIPTAINGDFFSGTPIEQATLYVPESSLLSYQSTSPWSRFGTILPISTTGIGEIATDGEAGIDAIYNLEGKRCNGTNRGLSIIRMSDGTTRKVLK